MASLPAGTTVQLDDGRYGVVTDIATRVPGGHSILVVMLPSGEVHQVPDYQEAMPISATLMLEKRGDEPIPAGAYSPGLHVSNSTTRYRWRYHNGHRRERIETWTRTT